MSNHVQFISFNKNLKNKHVVLKSLTKSNLKSFRQITTAALDSTYSEQWYKYCLKLGSLAQLAYYSTTEITSGDDIDIDQASPQNLMPVGCISAFIEKKPMLFLSSKMTEEEVALLKEEYATKTQVPSHYLSHSIYIMTLAVLAPFRNMYIGSILLGCIVQQAQMLTIPYVWLHVHTEAEESINWYLKRGFDFLIESSINGKESTERAVIKSYYSKMTPPGDAYILFKRV